MSPEDGVEAETPFHLKEPRIQIEIEAGNQAHTWRSGGMSWEDRARGLQTRIDSLKADLAKGENQRQSLVRKQLQAVERLKELGQRQAAKAREAGHMNVILGALMLRAARAVTEPIDRANILRDLEAEYPEALEDLTPQDREKLDRGL